MIVTFDIYRSRLYGLFCLRLLGYPPPDCFDAGMRPNFALGLKLAGSVKENPSLFSFFYGHLNLFLVENIYMLIVRQYRKAFP